MKQTTTLQIPGKPASKRALIYIFIGLITLIVVLYLYRQRTVETAGAVNVENKTAATPAPPPAKAAIPVTPDYKEKMSHIINGDSSGRWKMADELPMDGAIFPYKRVIAFYGNLYSTRMGILGELPKKEVLQKLQGEVKAWQAADSVIEVVPALHYIAVTAQGAPGKGGKYRLRMPFHQIDSVINMASQINALVFIDIQVGLSSLQSQVPPFLEARH